MAGELQEEVHELAEVLKVEGGKVVGARLPIQVQNKQLEYRPKNVSIGFATKYFDQGDPIFIRLEPGDATRYDMLLTPLRHPSAVEICPSYGVKSRDHALLSLINIGGRKTTFVTLDGYFTSNWYNDELSSENDFTRLAVAWFVGWFSYSLTHYVDYE